MQSRYYDPAICRFINADHYASTGQQNKYCMDGDGQWRWLYSRSGSNH
ncbi:MAG: hypothetical protein MR473_07895 [Clostridiales bacterium]|nr:hypothetical protein [Clostridiales bacterium]